MSSQDKQGRFPNPLAMLLVLLGVTSAGAWLVRSPEPSLDRSRTPSTSPQPRLKTEATAVVAEIPPSPVLRPLSLVANAIGPEPLFWLKHPGLPELSDTYAAVVQTPRPDACMNGGTSPVTTGPSPFDRPRLTVPECTLIAEVRDRAAARHISVGIVIATLPDWVDSNLQWMFDPMLDALQAAAAEMHYSLSGFDLVDVEPAAADVQPKGSVWPYSKVHELTPGALLFRRTDLEPGSDPTLLLVLLVGETATGGVHAAALATALDLSLQWNKPFAPQAKDSIWNAGAVRILGPTYSGSAPSLDLALRDAAVRHRLAAGSRAWFDLVTGSATSTNNPKILEQSGLATFRATTRSDPEALAAIARYLGRTDQGWQCGLHVGLLVEANTAWGSNVRTPNSAEPAACESCIADPEGYDQHPRPGQDPLPCATVAHFPLHISRLRAQLQRAQAATPAPLAPRAPEVSLNLGEGLLPTDRLPEETPELTAATVETMVSGLFDVLNDRQISAIGVLATDKRDHVYLAQEIALHRPNILPFTLESSLVYLHPDAAGFVRGTVIASTYPLNPRTQQWTQPSTLSSHQFGGSPAQGVFNALALLLGHPEITVDYNSPRAPSERRIARAKHGRCGEGDPDIDAECSPAVWLSVVGRDVLLPLAVSRGTGCSTPGAGARPYVSCKPNEQALASQGAFLDEYLNSHHLPFVETVALLLSLFIAQIWYWRWTAERAAAYANQEWSQRFAWKQIFAMSHHAAHGVQAAPACGAERSAGLAAMWGATVALLLWALKVGAIYASNAIGLTLEYAKYGVWVCAACGLLYVLWSLTRAFWPRAPHGPVGVARAALFVFAAAVFAVLMALTPPHTSWLLARVMAGVAFLAAVVAVFGDIGARRDALARWRRLPALLGVGAFVAELTDLVIDHWEPVEALLFADRATDLGSLVSPTACIVAVCVALFWWGTWNLHRAYLGLLPGSAVGIGALLEQSARSAAIDPKEVLGSSEQRMGLGVVPVTICVLLALFYGRFYVGTVDGRAFSAFVLFGPLCVAAVIGHTLTHSARLGRAVLRALDALEHHPEIQAFQAVGKTAFPWHISFKEPRFYQLAPLFASMERARRLLSQVPADDTAHQRVRPGELASEIGDSLGQLRGRHPGEKANSLLSRNDWQAIDDILKRFVSILDVTRWHTDCENAKCEGPLGTALEQMENAVFFHAAIVLRGVLTRLVSGFTIVFGALLLLLAGHLLYSFQGRVYWLSLDAVAIALTTLIAVRLLVALERDTVMSYIWRTTPGQISLFGGLTWRVVAYAAISLGTGFIVFFPELAGRMSDWLTSARSMLH